MTRPSRTIPSDGMLNAPDRLLKAPRRSERDRALRRPLVKRGLATVEAAVALPLLLVVTLGTIETTSVIFTKQALQSAAQECAREAALPEATVASVEQTMREFVERRDLQDVSVTMSPANPSGLSAGTTLTVTLSVPASSAGLIAGQFVTGDISASTTVVKSF